MFPSGVRSSRIPAGSARQACEHASGRFPLIACLFDTDEPRGADETHPPRRHRLSPQVLTETLYALAVPATRSACPWIPDDVHLTTTGSGKTTALFNLLNPETGWFQRLLRDYQLPLIHSDASCIHVIHHADGIPLEDIRGIEENHWAADTIIRLIRRLTETPESDLHVSLAMGRKTMGFYAGYALSLFGRPQDRMSHVLVSEPFEGKRNFYYPTPYDHAVTIRVGDRDVARNARDAEVELADIPFVPLRASLPDHIFSLGLGYAQTVQAIRDARPETAHLAYCPERTLLIANGREVRVTGPQMVIHLLAAARYRAAQSRDELLRAPLKGIPDHDWTRKPSTR